MQKIKYTNEEKKTFHTIIYILKFTHYLTKFNNLRS